MRKSNKELNSRNLIILVFSLLVLVVAAYFLTTGKPALYKSGARTIVGGSNR